MEGCGGIHCCGRGAFRDLADHGWRVGTGELSEIFVGTEPGAGVGNGEAAEYAKCSRTANRVFGQWRDAGVGALVSRGGNGAGRDFREPIVARRRTNAADTGFLSMGRGDAGDQLLCEQLRFDAAADSSVSSRGDILLCTPLLWALSLKADQFRWVAIVLLGLAASIAGAEKAGRRSQAV